MASKPARVYFFLLFLVLLLTLIVPLRLSAQTTVNLAANGGVPDHMGITFAGCSLSGQTMDCSYTQPVTCSTVAGSNQYTISGYTPTSADVGKHLIIGMSYGIDGSTSYVGAGGNGYYGQPLRVLVQSVEANTITGAAFANGSPSADAANTVTNAECDLETDNGPALQALVSAGDSVVIPAGNWGFDSAVQIKSNNLHIYCEPGAVLYDARDDNYYNTGSAGSIYFQRKLFSWEGVSGGGMDGCIYLGTNVAVKDNTKIPEATHEPNQPQPIYVHNSTGLMFKNLVGMNMWGDSFLSFGGNENYPTNGMVGTTYSTAKNIFTKNGWAYGLAVTFGSNNTFKNIVTRNDGPDIEPNDTAEANLTFGNTFKNVQSIVDYNPDNGSMFWSAGGNNHCEASSICNGGQTVTNANIEGAFHIFPTTTTMPPYTITGTWQNVVLLGNSTGAPTCAHGIDCSTN